MANLLRRQPPTAVGSAAPVAAGDLRTQRRFLRRQRLRRWRVLRLVTAALLMLALIGGGIWATYFSQVLAVRSVSIKGVGLLSQAQIRRAASVPMGVPLASIDLAAIDARVESLAAVRSAQVTRVWPHGVLIEIEERTVIATVEIAGQIRGMDASGVLFRDFAKAPRQYPRIRNETDVDTDALREAGKVLVALPTPVTAQISYVTVESIDRISLVLRDGRTVFWGSAEQSADKARVVQKLLVRRARSYDVSVPGLPTFRR
jgi:cell division protein FtsQ